MKRCGWTRFAKKIAAAFATTAAALALSCSWGGEVNEDGMAGIDPTGPSRPTPTYTQYLLTVNVSPSNGGYVTNDYGYTVSGTNYYNSGSYIYLCAYEYSGYTFTGWTGDSYYSSPCISFNIYSNMSLTANFSPVGTTYELNVSVSPTAGGTVTVNGYQTSGTTYHYYYEEAYVCATANSNYTFTGWSGASTSTSSCISVTMSGARSLTANFQQSNPNQRNITVVMADQHGDGWGDAALRIAVNGTTVASAVNLATGVVFKEDFEGSTTGWTYSYVYTNRWTIGNATSYSGSRSAYITGDGINHSQDYYGVGYYHHIYRDITFPVSNENFTLTFYYKGDGSNGLTVRHSSTSSTPSDGSPFSSGSSLGTTYYGSSSWQQATITLPAATFSGTTRRIVFTWYRGYYSYSSPAAIDDIVISTSSASSVSSTGSSGTYTFNANVGDLVEFFWVAGDQFDYECAFGVYYTDNPPTTPFDPEPVKSPTTPSGYLEDLYKRYHDLDPSRVTNGYKLGQFTVSQ